MSSPLRSVMAVMAGCLAAFFHIGAIDALGHLFSPLPADLRVIPVGVMLTVLLAWGVGTFAGAWLAARLAARAKRAHGMVVGALFLAAAVANLAAIPHPTWFWALSLATFLPAAHLGAALAAPSRRIRPLPPDAPTG